MYIVQRLEASAVDRNYSVQRGILFSIYDKRYFFSHTAAAFDERAIDPLFSSEIGSWCAIASRNRATFPMKKLLNERKLAAVHTRLPHACMHARRHAGTHARMLASSIYFKVKRFPFTHYDPTPCRLASYLLDYPTRWYHYQTREPKRAQVVSDEEKLLPIMPRWTKMKKLRYRLPGFPCFA